MAELDKFESDSRRLHPDLFSKDVLSGDAIPVRLPHYQIKDSSLYFLTSKSEFAKLSSAEKAVWNAIDGTLNLKDLRERFDVSVDITIMRFVDLSVCELLPVDFPPNRSRILVFEPHMDDAALSVGGIMWLRRYNSEFIIVTLAGISNWTTQVMIGRDYFDIETITQLRKAESEIYVRHIGGRHTAHPMLEAPLRYNYGHWKLDWFHQHRKSAAAFNNHTAGPLEHEKWAVLIEKTIIDLRPNEIWFPLGLGFHVDHELTRTACLSLFVSKPELFDGTVIKFYQDVPYASIAPNHMNDLVSTLKNAGTNLKEERVDISDVMGEKLQLLTLFRSQFKMEPIRTGVEASARNAAEPGKFGEVLYQVLALPTSKIESLACYPEKESVYSVALELEKWLRRNCSVKLIKILLAEGVGRWAEDMQLLLDVFHNTNFEVHVPCDCLVETETLASDRITVCSVKNRWKWWFADAVRTIVTQPGPLVLVSGKHQEQKRYAGILSMLSVGSDSIVAPTMNQFVLALRLVTSKDPTKGVK